MRSPVLIVFLSLALVATACDDTEPSTQQPSAPGTATATPLPDDGRLRLFDFDAGVWVTEVDVDGRIPLGLANGLLIDRAGTRLGPGPTAVFSVALGAPLDDFVDPVPPPGALVYEWVLHRSSDEVVVRLGTADGRWLVTVNAVVHEATISFGDRELAVRLPTEALALTGIDPTNGVTWSARTMRECPSCEIARVGDSYPSDGSAFPLVQY